MVVVCNKALAADGLVVNTLLDLLAKFHENMGKFIYNRSTFAFKLHYKLLNKYNQYANIKLRYK